MKRITISSPLVPIGVFCSNVFVLVTPQIIVPYFVLDGLELADWYVSVFFGAGILASTLGMVVFGYVGDRMGYQRACAFCFLCNFIGTLVSAMTTNIYVLLCCRLVVGMSAIIVICDAWTSTLCTDQDRHKYLTWLMQAPGFAILLGMIATVVIDHFNDNIFQVWEQIHYASAAVSGLTLLFLSVFKISNGHRRIANNDNSTLITLIGKKLVLVEFYLGVIESVIGVFLIYFLSSERQVSINQLIGLVAVTYITTAAVSVPLQLFMLKIFTKHDLRYVVTFACTVFMLIGLTLLYESEHFWAEFMPIVLASVFRAIAQGIVKDTIYSRVRHDQTALSRNMRAYNLSHRFGTTVGAFVLIPLYSAVHPYAVHALICFLYVMVFVAAPFLLRACKKRDASPGNV